MKQRKMSRQKQRPDPTVGIEKVEQCWAALRDLLADPGRADREWCLYHLTAHLFRRFEEQMLAPECLQSTLEIGRRLRSASGPGRINSERHFFEGLAALGWRCYGGLEPLKEGEFFDLVNLDRWDAEVRPIGRTMQALWVFAEETIVYAARPRDSFAGERRERAREILRHLKVDSRHLK